MFKLSSTWLEEVSSNMLLYPLETSAIEYILTFCHIIFQVHLALSMPQFWNYIFFQGTQEFLFILVDNGIRKPRQGLFSFETSLYKRLHIEKSNDPSKFSPYMPQQEHLTSWVTHLKYIPSLVSQVTFSEFFLDFTGVTSWFPLQVLPHSCWTLFTVLP